MEAFSDETDAISKRSATPTIELTAKIVAAFVSKNSVPIGDLRALITAVHGALTTVGGSSGPAPAPERPVPFVPIRTSVMPDYIVCLEDGRQMRMLKQHLKKSYGLSPDAYRAKWGVAARLSHGRAELCRPPELARQGGGAWPQNGSRQGVIALGVH